MALWPLWLKSYCHSDQHKFRFGLHCCEVRLQETTLGGTGHFIILFLLEPASLRTPPPHYKVSVVAERAVTFHGPLKKYHTQLCRHSMHRLPQLQTIWQR